MESKAEIPANEHYVRQICVIWLNPAVHWKVQRGGVKDELAELCVVNTPEETVTREVF